VGVHGHVSILVLLRGCEDKLWELVNYSVVTLQVKSYDFYDCQVVVAGTWTAPVRNLSQMMTACFRSFDGPVRFCLLHLILLVSSPS
jgi:hypothetical protein